MAGIVRCLGEIHGESYGAYWGDCIDVMRQLPDRSVGFSVYSPPFGSLFTYSDSECDIGNNMTEAEFKQHYGYAVREGWSGASGIGAKGIDNMFWTSFRYYLP